jgi:hypothetical protein
MTEPHAGADPTLFTTRAVRSGNEWVINGEKWFSSNARWSSFLIVMAVTDPEVDAHGGMSMFIVPTDTPGVKIIRNVGVGMERPEHASHAYIHRRRACRRTTCSARRLGLRSRRRGSAAAASTTRCGWWRSCARPST